MASRSLSPKGLEYLPSFPYTEHRGVLACGGERTEGDSHVKLGRLLEAFTTEKSAAGVQALGQMKLRGHDVSQMWHLMAPPFMLTSFCAQLKKSTPDSRENEGTWKRCPD